MRCKHCHRQITLDGKPMEYEATFAPVPESIDIPPKIDEHLRATFCPACRGFISAFFMGQMEGNEMRFFTKYTIECRKKEAVSEHYKTGGMRIRTGYHNHTKGTW